MEIDIKKLTAVEKKELKRLGQIIRLEREKQGLTLYGIEERGYSVYQHWQKVEAGERNITYVTLLNICKVLGLQPSELLRDIKIKIK